MQNSGHFICDQTSTLHSALIVLHPELLIIAASGNLGSDWCSRHQQSWLSSFILLGLWHTHMKRGSRYCLVSQRPRVMVWKVQPCELHAMLQCINAPHRSVMYRNHGLIIRLIQHSCQQCSGAEQGVLHRRVSICPGGLCLKRSTCIPFPRPFNIPAEA